MFTRASGLDELVGHTVWLSRTRCRVGFDPHAATAACLATCHRLFVAFATGRLCSTLLPFAVRLGVGLGYKTTVPPRGRGQLLLSCMTKLPPLGTPSVHLR
ncbi:unnamed protein product [Amoebophrya sp. A120]|nr:unnamed protein product [Amoebophrya sp. A120]|eukprot:GSA120T00023550001.1